MSTAAFAENERVLTPPRAVSWATVLAAAFVASMFYVADQTWGFSQLDLGQDVMELSTEEGSSTRRLGLIALGLAGAVLAIRRGGRPLRLRGVLAWLCLALVAWCASTWLWAADRPVVLRRLFAEACLVTAAVAAARWGSPRRLAWIALLCTATFLLVGVAAEVSLGLFRFSGGEHRFAGTMHPNDQGMNCAVLCLAALYLARGDQRGRFALLAVAAAAFGFLVLTKSRTSLGAFLVAVAAMQLLATSSQARLKWILGSVFVASWALLLSGGRIADSLAEAALLAREDSEAATLTGRLPLWEDLWGYVQSRPISGYGYSGYWIPQHISEVSRSQGWAIAVGHSAYLDLVLGVGIVGLALGLPILVLAAGQAAWRETLAPAAGYGFVFAVLVLCACDGVLESNVLLPRFVPLVAMSGVAMLALPTKD